jgi:hypothetical protein
MGTVQGTEPFFALVKSLQLLTGKRLASLQGCHGTFLRCDTHALDQSRVRGYMQGHSQP